MGQAKRVCRLSTKRQNGSEHGKGNYNSVKDYLHMRKKLKIQKKSRRRNRGS